MRDNKLPNESKVSNLGAAPVDESVAFKPFENNIYDTLGLLLMLDDLMLIERSLFRGKEGLISQKGRDFTTSSIISLFEEIEKTGLEPETDAKQLSFLKNLVSYLKGLPMVKVTLAFAPTNTFLERISNSISAIVGKKTLIDLVVNQYIVGGAIFEYKGKIISQTLNSKLDESLRKAVL